MIHPLAYVDPAANVAEGVEIAPCAVIEAGAVVGPGCRIASHAVIHSSARLAANVFVDCHASIGGLPQDTHFNPETASTAEIGEGTAIRESVTVHRATTPGGATKVGAKCLLMANAHVGHDCVVEDGAILANNVMLAGFVTIGTGTFVGGGAGMHQHLRIGERAMIGGLARVTMDVPPFCIMAERDRLSGLNLIGLRRAGFTREDIAELKKLFHDLLSCGKNPREAALALPDAELSRDCGRRLVEFLRAKNWKGVMRFSGGDADAD
jgi:UDP-N-acetylglucosamine acyltransferase